MQRRRRNKKTSPRLRSTRNWNRSSTVCSPPTETTTETAPTPSSTGLILNVKIWHGVGAWTWGAGDVGDVCGICRIAFDGCPPDAKFPGDDSPVVWGKCGHAFHLQCITKWLSGANAEAPRCPICRGAWEFKELEGADANANANANGGQGDEMST